MKLAAGGEISVNFALSRSSPVSCLLLVKIRGFGDKWEAGIQWRKKQLDWGYDRRGEWKWNSNSNDKEEDIDLRCISRVTRAPLGFLNSRIDLSFVRDSVKGMLYAVWNPICGSYQSTQSASPSEGYATMQCSEGALDGVYGSSTGLELCLAHANTQAHLWKQHTSKKTYDRFHFHPLVSSGNSHSSLFKAGKLPNVLLS